ncbi:MAG: PcfJ domain-containing protein [Oscillospiraceae bacterium]|nr:PcfJ domain-containing protein [Oscillospiraceae bacterium]
MRNERKTALLTLFPDVPGQIVPLMRDGKGANNYTVLLTRGKELFARCFHRYSDGRIEERQRYVFAKDGCFRAGSDDGRTWTIRREFREPLFCKTSYGYSFDNSYKLLNADAWRDSDMRYSELDCYTGAAPLEYLHLYCRHPNIEYLMKQGYASAISDDHHYMWYGQQKIVTRVDPHVDLRTNNLLKMLGLNRAEFRLLHGHECQYIPYLLWRERMPGARPEDLLLLARVFREDHGTLDLFVTATGLRPARLARYLLEHDVSLYDYGDHIRLCRRLGYDMRDTALSMPHDFAALHTRISDLAEYQENEANYKAFASRLAERATLEYASGSLLIRQPQHLSDIIREGKILHHCVGGYAARHANGKLHILFIRKTDAPDVPYYTMELSTEGEIVQVRGLRNCYPPEDVRTLIEAYKQYIRPLFENKRQKVRITA